MVTKIRMCPNKEVPSKSAFSMIELIFAIVIIGISVISLPMMTQATSKGVEGNLVQEAIFAASAQLNQVLSYQWDENAIDGNDTLSKVVCPVGTTRLGLINQPLHRKCIVNNISTTLGLEPGETISTADDIDDMNGITNNIFIDSGGGSVTSFQGYKNNYSTTINVENNAIFGTSNIANPNIKKVTVSITDSSGNLITLLKTYSANIGEIDYYKRSYQ
ncbi:MAG: hypothetical protein Q7S59_06140 [Sulfurimonas sp.]|nr:hypothetical protein [Sulfurimonas sp.]